MEEKGKGRGERLRGKKGKRIERKRGKERRKSR